MKENLTDKTELLEPAKITELILSENLTALKALLAKGWDVNEKLPAEDGLQTPLQIAFYNDKKDALYFLLDEGAKITNELFIEACEYGDDPSLVKRLIELGADVNASTHISSLKAAIYGKNEEIALLLIENGFRLIPDGTTLREAAMEGLGKLIERLIQCGFDVNYCEPDTVYPYNASALQAAASYADLALVKRLIELGADLSYEDKYGERAYHYALRNERKEVALYIKSVEPSAWHDDEERLKKLKSYKLPNELISLLRSNDRRVLLPGCEYTGFIEFASLGDVREGKWKNKKFLDLLIDADRYGADGFLVWHPSSKMLASADYEHGVFTLLCSFEEFMADPSAAINKIFK